MPMKYMSLPGSTKSVSRLIQGTLHFSDNDSETAHRHFDDVWARGCRAFDTAHGYFRGGSERALGAWIAARGVRDEAVIFDKGAHPYDGQQRVTPEDITSDIRDSLERLQTDYIDVFLLHRDDPNVPVEPIIDVLNAHKSAGRIRAFGGSNWRHERLAAANDYALAHGLTPFQASSPQWSLAKMVEPPWNGCISIGADDAAQAWYKDNPVALSVWSTLAGGFMTGRYRRDNLETFTGRYETVTVAAYAYEENFRRLDRAQQLADVRGVHVAQIALAYVLNQPLGPFVVVGSQTTAEFDASLHALDITLSPQEMAWLNLESDDEPGLL